MKKTAIVIFAAVLAGPALAQHEQHGKAISNAAAGAMAEGEVRKVDKTAKTVTLKHGPIPLAGMGSMPPMTMAFAVADPKWIDQLQPGDKVRFAAEDRGGTLVVTRIEKAKP